MDNIENYKNYIPQIGIRRQSTYTILTVNKKPLEIPDILDSTMADYIEMGRAKIDTELAEIRRLQRSSDLPNIRPSILIGRLALIGSEEKIFNQPRIEELSTDEIFDGDLQAMYQPYWLQIEQALYRPQIFPKILRFDPELGGTWLGLRRP